MNVTILFGLSEAGRKASILAGGSGMASQTIEVPPDSPDFARALDAATVNGRGQALLDLDSCDIRQACLPGWRAWDRVPSVAAILDDLDARRAAKIVADRAEVDRARAETAAVLAERRTVAGTRFNSDPYGYYPVTLIDLPRSPSREVTESPEWTEWTAEIERQNGASRDAWLAESAAALAAELADKAARAAAETARRAALGMGDGDDDFEFESGALCAAPCWEAHKRGKNWLATIAIDPRSPGGLSRVFCPTAKGDYYYVLPPLAPGDAVEFGADYYSGSGNPSRERWYGYVVRIDPESDGKPGRLILHKCKSGKDAVVSGKAFAAR